NVSDFLYNNTNPAVSAAIAAITHPTGLLSNVIAPPMPTIPFIATPMVEVINPNVLISVPNPNKTGPIAAAIPANTTIVVFIAGDRLLIQLTASLTFSDTFIKAG